MPDPGAYMMLEHCGYRHNVHRTAYIAPNATLCGRVPDASWAYVCPCDSSTRSGILVFGVLVAEVGDVQVPDSPCIALPP